MKLALFLVGLAVAVATAELRLANKIEGFDVKDPHTQVLEDGSIIMEYILRPRTAADAEILPVEEEQVSILPLPVVEQPQVVVSPVLPSPEGPSTYPIPTPGESYLPVEPEGSIVDHDVVVNPVAGNKLPQEDYNLGVQPVEDLKPGTYPGFGNVQKPGLAVQPVVEQPAVSILPVGGHKLPQEEYNLGVQPVEEKPQVSILPAAGNKLPQEDYNLGVQPVEEKPQVSIHPVAGNKLPQPEQNLGIQPVEGTVSILPVAGNKLPQPEQNLGVQPVVDQPEAVVMPVQPSVIVNPIERPAEPSFSIMPVYEDEPAVGIRPVDQNVIVKPVDQNVVIQPKEPSFSVMPIIEEEPAVGPKPVIVQPMEPVVSIQPIAEHVEILPGVPEGNKLPVIQPEQPAQVIVTPTNPQVGILPEPHPQILPVEPVIKPAVGHVEDLYEYDAELPYQPKPVYFPHPENIIF